MPQIREFICEPDGSLRPVSQRRMNQAAKGERPFPEYAGRSLRKIVAVMAVVDRKEVGIRWLSGTVQMFDDEGRPHDPILQQALDWRADLAMAEAERASGGTVVNMRKTMLEDALDARRWEPGEEYLDEVRRLIWPLPKLGRQR